AARPVSRAQRVLGHEESAIQPTRIALVPRLELGPRLERLHVVDLPRELLGDRVVAILLSLETRRAQRRRRLAPERRQVLIVRAIEPQLARQLVLAGFEGPLERDIVVDHPA